MFLSSDIFHWHIIILEIFAKARTGWDMKASCSFPSSICNKHSSGLFHFHFFKVSSATNILQVFLTFTFSKINLQQTFFRSFSLWLFQRLICNKHSSGLFQFDFFKVRSATKILQVFFTFTFSKFDRQQTFFRSFSLSLFQSSIWNKYFSGLFHFPFSNRI